MKLPRDVSGDDLCKALRQLGYQIIRQTGSHIRLVTEQNGQHHVTVPKHNPMRIGTFSGILADVAKHHQITRDELIDRIF